MRQGVKNKYIESKKWRERGSEKGEIESMCMFGGEC